MDESSKDAKNIESQMGFVFQNIVSLLRKYTKADRRQSNIFAFGFIADLQFILEHSYIVFLRKIAIFILYSAKYKLSIFILTCTILLLLLLLSV